MDIFDQKSNKKYIIRSIIYKRVENVKMGVLSYGYLMVMLWISCGEGAIIPLYW